MRRSALLLVLPFAAAAGCKHMGGSSHSSWGSSSSSGSSSSIGHAMSSGGGGSSSSHSSWSAPSASSSSSHSSWSAPSSSSSSSLSSHSAPSPSSWSSSIPSYAPLFHSTPTPAKVFAGSTEGSRVASAAPSAPEQHHEVVPSEHHHRARAHHHEGGEGGGIGDIVIVEPWIEIAPEPADIPEYPAADAPSATTDIKQALTRAGVEFNEWSDAQEGDRGVAIGGIVPQSAADQAGLSAGDVILAVGSSRTPGNMESVSSMRDLASIPISPGQSLIIRYVRAGAQNTLRLEVP